MSQFTNEFSKFIAFFRVWGYCPFSKTSPILNKLLVLYTFLNATVIISIFISAFFIQKVFSNPSSELSAIVAGLVFITLIITYLLNIFQSLINRGDQISMWNNLNDIDVILEKKLFTKIPYKKLRWEYFLKIGSIILILIIVQVLFLYSLMSDSIFCDYYLHHFYPAFALRIRGLQNMFYVDLIKEMLLILNVKLEELIQLGGGEISEWNNNMIMLVEQHKNQSKHRSLNKKQVYNEILLMKQIYGKIWDVCNLINDSFGWSLLLITTQNFIEFTSNGYWLFLSLENIIPMSVTYDAICALIPVILLMSLLAYSCFRCTQCVIKKFKIYLL